MPSSEDFSLSKGLEMQIIGMYYLSERLFLKYVTAWLTVFNSARDGSVFVLLSHSIC